MPLPILKGARIQLCPYTLETLSFFRQLVMDEDVMKFCNGILPEHTIEQLCQNFLLPDPPDEVWGVFLKESFVYVGHAALIHRPKELAPEILYYLAKSFWGQGYGFEIAQVLLQFAFQQANYSAIIGTVDEENLASIKILERLKMNFIRKEKDEFGFFRRYEITQEQFKS